MHLSAASRVYLGRISAASRPHLGHVSAAHLGRASRAHLGYICADLDLPLGLTYLYFAAEGGAVGAQLALGYRHLLGVQMAKVSYRSYRSLSLR